jgi:hypothetical protein
MFMTMSRRLCRNFWLRTERSERGSYSLCREPLGERQLLSAGGFRLSLSHHVHHFDAAQERASGIVNLAR